MGLPPVTKQVPRVWLRSRLAYVEPGRKVSEADYDMLITGEADVYKGNGDRLCCVRRGVVSAASAERALPTLRMLKSRKTSNRGVAAGGDRGPRIKQDGTLSNTTISTPVSSSVIGYFDRYPRIPYCRQTAFNAEHSDKFDELRPMLGELAATFKASVPERYIAQMGYVHRTPADFVIRDTPWTTLTVNHNWPTCTHLDAGDLEAGFSCLTVLRGRGSYRGAVLVFPAFRVGVDLGHGDMIMMDAHEYHANTPFVDASEDYERIAVVLYYREKMAECGSAAEELERAKALHGSLVDEDEA